MRAEAFVDQQTEPLYKVVKEKWEMKSAKVAVECVRDQWFQELPLKVSWQPLSLVVLKLDEGEWLDCGIIGQAVGQHERKKNLLYVNVIAEKKRCVADLMGNTYCTALLFHKNNINRAPLSLNLAMTHNDLRFLLRNLNSFWAIVKYCPLADLLLSRIACGNLELPFAFSTCALHLDLNLRTWGKSEWRFWGQNSSERTTWLTYEGKDVRHFRWNKRSGSFCSGICKQWGGRLFTGTASSLVPQCRLSPQSGGADQPFWLRSRLEPH